jgi:predicted dehydrogenase
MSHTDRRSFLFGAAAAVTSAGLAGAEEQEIRAAYIGVGSRGSELLRLSLSEPNVKIAAICDIDPTMRDRGVSGAAAHSPQSMPEWRAVLDLKGVDAVFIATPCDLHAEMAAACLKAGKYVYCEKPLGITPEQVERVLRASRRSSAFLQIGQQLRYYYSVREAIRQIHAGVLGKAYIIKAHRHGGRSRPREGGPEPTTQAKARSAWYANVKRSGDLIVENAVHNIDACIWIANSKPVSAYGHGKKYFPQPISPGTVMMDGFSVEYIYENDMHCDYSQISFHPRHLQTLPSGMWYTIFGEKGIVYMTHESAHFYDLYGETEPKDLLDGQGKDKEDAVTQFFADIRAKRKPFADIRVGAIAALSAIMGREAIYRGRSVTWKDLGVDV